VRIRDIFHVKAAAGDIGLEIEVEGTNLPSLLNNTWKSVPDNSLKGGKEGIEYVMLRPAPMDQLEPILKEFNSYFYNSLVDDSIYAGIHAHVNVQNLTPKQLLTFLVCFFVLEDVLVKWCGKTRTGNHFCLRTSDAEYLIHHIREMVMNDTLNVGHKDSIRYSAANLESLSKYGSIEFRCLNSTIDPNRILTWCKVLNNILNQSLTYASPDAVITGLSVEGNHFFVNKMLGADAKKFLTEGWEDAILDGMSRAQDIAFCRDWATKLNLNIFKKSEGIFNG
jgi:hypothetical protein